MSAITSVHATADRHGKAIVCIPAHDSFAQDKAKEFGLKVEPSFDGWGNVLYGFRACNVPLKLAREFVAMCEV